MSKCIIFLLCGLNKVYSVVVVLLHAGGDGQDVGVEDDVGGVEAHHLSQDAEGPLTDLDLASFISSL